MAKGVTVIFGTIRTATPEACMRGLSGPPPGAWTKPCAETPVRHLPHHVQAKPRTPTSDTTTNGRDFTRRVRTYLD